MLRPAADSDLAAVVALVNSAYRGESSRQGWTHEADYIDGDRIEEETLRADLAAKPQAHLLLHEDGEHGLLGCVWLEPAGEAVWYLGMLAVRPDLQDGGRGRRLLAAGEAFAQARGARRIRISVVGVRDTLIAWYQRRGYALTGETLPFIYVDPPRPDLTLVVLDKTL